MIKKIFILVTLLMSSVAMSAQDNSKAEAMKAANDIIYDVAHGKMERFNWLTLSEIPQLFHPKNERYMREWKKMFGNPEDEILPILQGNKKDGSAIGIDWNNVTVTDIRYQSEYDDEWGTEEMKGYIFLKSRGKPYRIFFKRGFLLDGKWRFILLRSMSQTSEIPSDYPKSGKN